MEIGRWISDKITMIAHRVPEPPSGPDSEPASGEAVVSGAALTASRDAARHADAQREAWFQYLEGQESANGVEARWFETFREADRRAQAQYREERQAWFKTFGEADHQALEAYREERWAFLRYTHGQEPRDGVERQRFARFEREIAQADYEAEA